ncbi:hypothetical protein AtEden1_Chr5g0125851 [Arabidopsis thaliana]
MKRRELNNNMITITNTCIRIIDDSFFSSIVPSLLPSSLLSFPSTSSLFKQTLSL